LAAVALAGAGFTVASASPAQAAQAVPYSNETFQETWHNTAGTMFAFIVGPLHKTGSTWFSFSGEKVTFDFLWATLGEGLSGYVECVPGTGATVIQQVGPYAKAGSKVSLTLTAPDNAVATAKCLGRSSRPEYDDRHFWWTITPKSTTPSISSALTGSGTHKAGTEIAGKFAYSHKTFMPWQTPSVDWKVTPEDSRNTFTVEDSVNYKFVPKVPGSYTIAATVNGGADNPGTIRTTAALVVTPADVEKISITPSVLAPRRGTAVTFDAEVTDPVGNVLTSSSSDLFFASSDASDATIPGGIKFGSKAGPRTVTATYLGVSTTLDMTVPGEPVVSAPGTLSLTAGEPLTEDVAVDAYPEAVTHSCMLPAGIDRVTWKGNAATVTATKVGTAKATCVSSNATGSSQPWSISVRTASGPAAKLSIDQSGTTHQDGQAVALTWKYQDDFGNPADGSGAAVAAISSTVPTDRINLSGRTVTLSGAGTRTITVAAAHQPTGRAITGRAALTATAVAAPPAGTQNIGGEQARGPATGAEVAGVSVPVSELTAAQAAQLAPVAGSGGVPGTTVAVPASATGGWTDVAYQWFRNGESIKGATSAHYTVKAADAGRRLTVRITRRGGGIAETFTLHEISVPKLASKVKLAPRMRNGAPAVEIEVSVAKLTQPTGKIVIRAAGQRKAVRLTAKHKGKILVPLANLPRGKTVLVTVSYKGTSQIQHKTLRAKGQWR
jgi:hypothetical protein